MGIPEGISKVLLPDIVPGAQQGLNDTGQIGYDGPKPPPGHAAHRYEFRVYALDGTLQLTPGATRPVFRAAIQDHVLARGKLVGTFSR
jgi:Raf kinase inhibitor-like YbhB/YbcL family protein